MTHQRKSPRLSSRGQNRRIYTDRAADRDCGDRVLAAILIPAVGKVRERANGTKCVSNLRQIGLAMKMYAGEHNGTLTMPYSQSGPKGEVLWFDYLLPYMGVEYEGNWTWEQRKHAVFNCPSADHVLEFEGVSKFTYTYGWNSAFYRDGRFPNPDTGEYPSGMRLINIQRPSQSMLIADTIQMMGGVDGAMILSLTGDRLTIPERLRISCRMPAIMLALVIVTVVVAMCFLSTVTWSLLRLARLRRSTFT